MPVLGVYPDAEIVAAAWIMSIPNIEIDLADWRLPWDLNTPVHNGYAQVTVIGGVPLKDSPYFESIIQVDCWVEAPSEDRIFRMQASALAKQLQYACLDRKNVKRGVLPQPYLWNGQTITYANAHVASVYCMQEPHRMQSTDNSLYEGYSMDMMFTWTANIDVN